MKFEEILKYLGGTVIAIALGDLIGLLVCAYSTMTQNHDLMVTGQSICLLMLMAFAVTTVYFTYLALRMPEPVVEKKKR